MKKSHGRRSMSEGGEANEGAVWGQKDIKLDTQVDREVEEQVERQVEEQVYEQVGKRLRSRWRSTQNAIIFYTCICQSEVS